VSGSGISWVIFCISLQTDNHAIAPPLGFFTGWMPFLLPNQQRLSTEGTIYEQQCTKYFVTIFVSGDCSTAAGSRAQGNKL